MHKQNKHNSIKKKKRMIRKRNTRTALRETRVPRPIQDALGGNDDDDDCNADDDNMQPSSSTIVIKKKKNRKKMSSVDAGKEMSFSELSFGGMEDDDDDDDKGHVVRSFHDKHDHDFDGKISTEYRPAADRHRERRKRFGGITASTTTSSRRRMRREADNSEDAVVNGLQSQGQHVIVTAVDADDIDVDSGDVDMSSQALMKGTDATAAQLPFNIPGAAQIREAKERRRRLREGRAAEMSEHSEEFIPLSQSKQSGMLQQYSDNWNESRLVREDMDGPGDEDVDEVFEDLRGSTIRFGVEQQNVVDSAKMALETEEIEESGVEEVDEEEEQEMREWEMEQMKKAGIAQSIITKDASERTQSSLKRRESDAIDALLDEEDSAVIDEEMNVYSKRGGGGTALASFEEIEKKLSATLFEIESDYNVRVNALERLTQNIEESEKKIQEFDHELENASSNYELFQELMAYVNNLCDCMDFKMPQILDIEQRSTEIRQQYYTDLYQNWLNSLGIGGVSAVLDIDANYVQSDLYQRFTASIGELIEDAEDIFADVSENYADIGHVKKHFLLWRQEHKSSYRDTYCALSLQKVFLPFVKHELMCEWWDPIHQSPEFERFEWWRQLIDYGVGDDDDDDGDVAMKDNSDTDMDQDDKDKDADDRIVPELVKKACVPIARHTITFGLMAHSSHITEIVQQTIEEIETYLPPDDPIITMLLQTVINRIAQCCSDIVTATANRSLNLELLRIIGQVIVNTASWLPKYGSLMGEQLRHIVLENIFKSRFMPMLVTLRRQGIPVGPLLHELGLLTSESQTMSSPSPMSTSSSQHRNTRDQWYMEMKALMVSHGIQSMNGLQ